MHFDVLIITLNRVLYFRAEAVSLCHCFWWYGSFKDNLKPGCCLLDILLKCLQPQENRNTMRDICREICLCHWGRTYFFLSFTVIVWVLDIGMLLEHIQFKINAKHCKRFLWLHFCVLSRSCVLQLRSYGIINIEVVE